DVAAPVLAAAPLDDGDWAMVLKAASKEVQGFMKSLRGSPQPVKEEAAESTPSPTESDEIAPSIGEMVARIERLKSKRDTEPQAEQPLAAKPAGAWQSAAPSTGPNLFRWECDASGQIGWVEGAPRGALVGRSIPGIEGAPRELVRAFTDRLPFDDTPLSLPTPALEGGWRLSGIPAFSPSDGRFLGYRGIARREGVDADLPPAALPRPGGADAEALRETIHEIKTPLNAIIGFAEIIDGQYLGPAHRNYRHRASEIVAHARHLLAAIEDLDLAAQLQAKGQAGAVTDFAEVLPPIAEELGNRALSRDVRLRIVTSLGSLRCGMEPELARRLLARLLGAAVDSAPDGQQVEVDVRDAKRVLTIAVTRPASTRQLSDEQMMDPSFQAEGPDSARLGLGFALRLVRGLARLAGGDLKLGVADFQLTLPGAA
ncbi:MAG TPA: histidine kinase dimerization/phospho-acceptor domain-containing protein, partial [Sphingomicrobium sp.]|nr:histidine kinase dimerization/phospho-acceptor domain-containing protein [Sphingomicrobium sp.]